MATDFFGQTVEVGDVVAVVGKHYQELTLYTVTKVTPQKFAITPVDPKQHSWDHRAHAEHKQCVKKPYDNASYRNSMLMLS